MFRLVQLHLQESQAQALGLALQALRKAEEMRGDMHFVLELVQQLQEHAKDLLAFGGIGAGAQLVEDDERATLGVLEERADARELHPQPAFFLIGVGSLAERHKHAADKPDRSVLRGHESARLSEQLTQPERLQKARLATGVRAGRDAGVDEAR